MKKNFKKFASLMLALVMAFALAAPAFAADYATVPVSDITVSLQLVGKNGNIYTKTNVSVSAGTTAYDLVTKYLPEDDTEPDWSEWNTYGNSKYLQAIYVNDEFYATEPLSAAPAEVKVEAWHNGYGRVSYNPDTQEYTYIYAGYAWMYDVTGGSLADQNVNELTMNQFVLHDGNTVVLNYNVQISQPWTTTDVLPGLGV